MVIFPNEVFSRPRQLHLLMFQWSQWDTGVCPGDMMVESLLELGSLSLSLETVCHPLSSSKILCWNLYRFGYSSVIVSTNSWVQQMWKTALAPTSHPSLDLSFYWGALQNLSLKEPSVCPTPWLWVGACDLFKAGKLHRSVRLPVQRPFVFPYALLCLYHLH